jgi:Zn-finger nucleic acid-binding protein
VDYRTAARRFGDLDGRATTLRCPRGHGYLLERDVAHGLSLSYCGDCGGVFASRGAFLRVRNWEDHEVEEFATWLRGLLIAAVDPKERASCPECGAPMDRMTKVERDEGIAIDTCREHGVWFDGGELEAGRAHEPLPNPKATVVTTGGATGRLGPPDLKRVTAPAPGGQAQADEGFVRWLLRLFGND